MIALFKRTTILTVLLCLTPLVGLPQVTPQKKVSATYKLSQENAHAGTMVQAALVVDIERGWHINSNIPSDENMIGTTITFEKNSVLDSVEVSFPPAMELQFGFAENPLEVYDGTIHVMLKLFLATELSPATYTVPVTIRYQACNDNICLAPTSVEVALPFHIVADSDSIVPANRELFEGIH